jgi:hypothetical protein
MLNVYVYFCGGDELRPWSRPLTLRRARLFYHQPLRPPQRRLLLRFRHVLTWPAAARPHPKKNEPAANLGERSYFGGEWRGRDEPFSSRLQQALA